MCDGCDTFPLGCGSPECLTGEENLAKKFMSYKGDRLTNPESVKGFEKLTNDQQQLFESFLSNFYKRWEYPERHIPVNVAATWDKSSGKYLRVDFKDGQWFHVKGPNTWY
ncbi:hypothetical protein Desaci_4138 [Desulfosporosinus acidiphilus SJ4]|uniref:Uncharacterized protein n=1 Tax=Desulfosporosinus acidiphilus (strain DSM 22704 / JCM 16185 / SJ4) TaxID=646529 RepID=I4DB26_DESAJ|nr:hypothetical protein [Desulfosporosinus acidiphilus]AFM43000.1 hypothetical protein Desaci_4138 [Desulfosporosinus acidiphilus SJ4]